jgi:hypothetical protein
MFIVLALALAFGRWQAPATSSGPRVSATGTPYLSCTAWTGKNWTSPTARSSRTPEIESPKGFLAYAEVRVIVKDGSCENTTTLYVASGSGQPFKIAYTKAPSDRNGNGIRLIGWSPNGDKLLAEVNLWDNESDSGFEHVALVYDASTNMAKEVHPDRALSRRFGPNCEFELAIESWKADGDIVIKVSKSPETEQYEQHFCVKEPRTFVFDLQKEIVKDESQERRKAN